MRMRLFYPGGRSAMREVRGRVSASGRQKDPGEARGLLRSGEECRQTMRSGGSAASQHVLHLVLQMEFLLFELDFFELL